MRSKIVIIGIIFTFLSGAILVHRAQAQTSVNIDLFYEELSPYGGWSPHVEFGYVWQPYDVGPHWKPYTDGRWAWSDQGWIWISYEPWGWATYHYGRWVYDDYQGWIWIPGTTWAPAWVSWYQSPEYIGWSPLPPDRGFFIEIGISFNIYKPYHYKPYHYKHRHKKHRYYHDYYYNHHNYKPPARHSVFLPSHSFGHHKHAGKAAIPDPHYTVVLRNSKNITNIKHVNNKVINYGPDKHYIEKRSNRKLVKHSIVDRNNVALRGKENVNVVKGNIYNVYRPKIERKSGQSTFIKTKRNEKLDRSNGVTNEKINNSVNYNSRQFYKTGVNTDFQEKQDIQNRKHNVSKNKGISNKTGNRGNSNITSEKVYKQNKQKDLNKQAYKTSSNGKNNFNRELRQQNKSKLPQPENKLRTLKTQGNKFTNNKKNTNTRRSTENNNTNRVKSYDKSRNGHNNQLVNRSNKKTYKSNYSSKNKSASSGNGKVSQRRYNNTATRKVPSSNRPAFSRR